jgi:transcriptional regulator with XRE-family HTH domain
MSVSAPQESPGDATHDKGAAKRVRGMVVNASSLKKARNDRGWSQDTLALKAGVSIGTVSRAERGIEIERDGAEKLADALKMSVAELLPDAPPVSPAKSQSCPPDRERREIVFAIDGKNRDAAELARLAGNILAEVHRNGVLRDPSLLVTIEVRSIHVIVDITKADAARLQEAFEKGYLAHLKVTDVKTIPSAKTPAPGRKYGFVFGCVSFVCGLIGFIPLVRLPVCVLGLILGGIGVWLGSRRKAGWIVPGVAIILNATVLVMAASGVLGAWPPVGNDVTPKDTRGSEKLSPAEQPKDDQLPALSGKRVTLEAWGAAGFEFSGTVKIKGEHGGDKLVLQCWDDSRNEVVTLAVNNQQDPRAGFQIYRSELGNASLASAIYYPVDDEGHFQAGVDLLKSSESMPKEGEGANRSILFYGNAIKWPRGGEWRIVYRYAK